jgi:TRAP-type C4-dicarboxylate transport system permease small subunit
MNQLLRLEQLVVSGTRALAFCGFVGLMVMSISTTLDVLLRWLANIPIKGLFDIVSLAVVIVIATSFPVVIAQRQNITIRFLGDVIGPRTALWFDAVGSAALLVFITLVGWQMAVYAGELIESGRTTWQLRIHTGPYWSVAAGIVLLCIPIQTIAFVADIMRAITGAPRAREGGPDDSVPETLA